MNDFVVGDRVRVIIDMTSTVDRVEEEFLVLGNGEYVDLRAQEVTIETIEPDLTVYEQGVAYCDPDGDIFVYLPDLSPASPWFAQTWLQVPDAPLVRLTPEEDL